jgi:hypothetical protein
MKKRKYDLIDGIFTLFLVIALFMGDVILMNIYLDRHLSFQHTSDDFMIISQMIFSLIFIFVIALYMLLRKQKPETVGFALKSLRNHSRLDVYIL